MKLIDLDKLFKGKKIKFDMSCKNELILIGLIGIGAMSGASFSLGVGNSNWKNLAMSSSLGCIIMSRLFNNTVKGQRILEIVY